MAWHDNYTYDELNVEAKLNGLAEYVHNLCAYGDFGNMKSIEELEYCVREFCKLSDYTLDKNGNWYDEDFQKI